MRERRHMLPVWFFIGILLSVYGAIILVTSLTEWARHTTATQAAVLARLHPGVWGGVVLLVVGGFYALRYRPRRSRGGDDGRDEK
jgi:hypothetical protein